MVVKNLPEYAGKYVTVTYRDEKGAQVAADGKVLKANALAIYIQVKGKGKFLIDVLDLETITEVNPPTKTSRIKVRAMAPVADDQIRQHLADRHGVPVAEIPDDASNAAMMHSGINHEGLGHVHRADIETVAKRAEIIGQADASTEDEDDDDCEHAGIECDGSCNCICSECGDVEGYDEP